MRIGSHCWDDGSVNVNVAVAVAALSSPSPTLRIHHSHEHRHDPMKENLALTELSLNKQLPDSQHSRPLRIHVPSPWRYRRIWPDPPGAVSRIPLQC